MTKRRAIRFCATLAGLGLMASVPCGDRWIGPRVSWSRVEARPGAGTPAPTADERAILELDGAFVRHYDKGESKALAALFAEDAEVVEADGSRSEGRGEVEQGFVETFAASPGSTIKFEIESIRLLGPSVAREEGRSVVTPAKGVPVARSYLALYIKRDGRWLISSVREEHDPTLPPRDRLKDLEWMIGDWVDEGPDSEVRVQARWSEDGNFLIRSFTVRRRGKPVMTVSQRIGWDPLARQFRSWEFDSEGGFGEGRWSRDGDRWVVKHTGVRPEGTTGSATNILAPVRPDLVRWTSVDRVIGDVSAPDDPGYTLVRVPPPPGLTPKTPANPAPTPSPSRSPR